LPIRLCRGGIRRRRACSAGPAGTLAAETTAADQSRAAVRAAIAATSVEDLAKDPKLLRAAIEGGRAAFKVNCVQCHGSGAAGGKGYPNLNDDDWLWGGDIATIHQTLEHGIRIRVTMPLA
jgi:cytochrome c oxidase cbb3-type subunit 3